MLAIESQKQTELTVETRWDGLNRGLGGGPILIFRTVVWVDPAVSALYGPYWYSTREEALTSHAKVIWSIYSGVNPAEEVPFDAKCVVCQDAPVRERFRTGAWTCLDCQINIAAGSLPLPQPLVSV